MSTVQQPTHTAPPVVAPVGRIPQLHNGDRLTRAEFERRYEAMPHVNKAELIEGIVYMPSPVRIDQHGEPHVILSGWLFHYYRKTFGLHVGDNSTSRLDEDNAPQPDLLLLLPPSLGGTGQVDEDGYVSGTPDLVVEIAANSASIDINDKMNAYRRNGVREYLVIRTEDKALDWFELVESRFIPKTADDKGYLRSKLFPGLWFDPAAFLSEDLDQLIAALDEGIATVEHREFVKKLTQTQPK